MSRQFDKSMALYDRASKTVPLATQTYSKAATNFVLGATPAFLDRGDGAHVWDVDGNRYVDYVGGLLPIVLGYCDPDVDAAIRAQLEKGILFSLATELESELSELLVRLIPSAEMVRFGKNGSDVTTAAIRIARAATGRDKVAICGYHGWHDWYIGTTERKLGVPECVQDLSATFSLQDPDTLADLLKADPEGYAAIIMEPTGKQPTDPAHLRRVRDLADQYGAILIFDEIVTGFRMHLGGVQAAYDVVPDMSCFGKAMANGMPISALVGRRDLMQMMDRIFFSATFGGEALSMAAAIATIRKLEREDVPNRLAALGQTLTDAANDALRAHKLDNRVRFGGEDWWPRVTIEGDPAEQALTNALLRQECAENGLLFAASFNMSFAHTADAIQEETVSALDKAAASLADAFAAPDPSSRLRGENAGVVFTVR